MPRKSLRNNLKLTPREKIIIRYMEKYIMKNGYPPTLEEITAGSGLVSLNMINKYLSRLEYKGYIKKNGKGTRKIILLKDANGEEKKVAAKEFYVKKQLKDVPVVKNVIDQGEILNKDNIIDKIPILVDFMEGKKCFIFQLNSGDFKSLGIFKNDYLLIKQEDNLENIEPDSVVFVIIDNGIVLKKLTKSAIKILDKENAVVLGKVCSVFRKICQ